MKILIRLFLAFVVLVFLLIGAAYLYLTNPGVQKRIVEQNLPDGSSIESVHLTLSQIELSGLQIVGEDGSRFAVGELRGDFSPMAAVLGKTIKVGELVASGVQIDLAAAPDAGMQVPSATPQESTSEVNEVEAGESGSDEFSTEEAASGVDGLYEIGRIPWLLDVRSIQVDGVLTDGRGGSYRFELTSNAIQPGQETTLSAALNSRFAEPTANGLKSFKAELGLSFLQKITGGFESFRVELDLNGKDAADSLMVAVDQVIEFEIDDSNKTAKALIQLNADLRNPEVLMPELSQFGAILVASDAEAQLEGEQLLLSNADFTASSDGREVVAVDLKKPLVLGGAPNLEGELLDLQLIEFPSEWLKPWLPSDLTVRFSPLSVNAKVIGGGDGAMKLEFNSPLQINKLQIAQAGSPMIDGLDFSVMPSLTAYPDESVDFALSDLSVVDEYGTILSGDLRGHLGAEAGQAGQALEGVLSEANLNIKLQPLVNQPVLMGTTSMMSGDLKLRAKVDGSAAMPLQLDAQLIKLRARGLPGQAQDYRFKVEAVNPVGQQWQVMVELLAGRGSTPGTDLRVNGSADLESQPFKFDVQLRSEQIRKSDLEVLAEAFKPAESEPAPADAVSTSTAEPSALATPVQTNVEVDNRPPWADLDGTASVQVDRLELNPRQSIEQITANLVITEPLLELSNLAAHFGSGRLSGSARVNYVPAKDSAYLATANVEIKDLDPGIFATGGSFPVNGMFDATLTFDGDGGTLEEALDRSDSTLQIVGRDGVFTAFEMDDRQVAGIGLIGGLLGKELDRPGISAVAEAIPYFKDIRFSELLVDLGRQRSGRVDVTEISMLGESILFDGTGTIDASSWDDIMTAPMDLRLLLGAKGPLEEPLEVLNLLEDEAGADGYRRWNQEIRVPGSLSHPDTGSLKKVLRDAATSAIRKPSKSDDVQVAESQAQEAGESATEEPEGEAQEKAGRSGTEKTIDEVEMGLDLINSFFGKE